MTDRSDGSERPDDDDHDLLTFGEARLLRRVELLGRRP